jgi:LemA protein
MPPLSQHVVLTALAFAIATITPIALAITVYRRLTRLRGRGAEAWNLLRAELETRHELVPRLVEALRATGTMSREILAGLLAVRAEALAPAESLAEKAAAENRLVEALRELFVLVERQPALADDRGLREMQEALAANEDRLHAAQRYFNVNIRDYNARLVRFPASLVATWFGLLEEECFVVEDSQIKRPQRDRVWSLSAERHAPRTGEFPLPKAGISRT